VQPYAVFPQHALCGDEWCCSSPILSSVGACNILQAGHRTHCINCCNSSGNLFQHTAHNAAVLNHRDTLPSTIAWQHVAHCELYTPHRSGQLWQHKQQSTQRAAILNCVTPSPAQVPGNILQAEDRAHRIGQASCVSVQFLLAKGSIDDLMWNTVQTKLDSIGTVLDGQRDRIQARTQTGTQPYEARHAACRAS
jgi:hypothetical protein